MVIHAKPLGLNASEKVNFSVCDICATEIGEKLSTVLTIVNGIPTKTVSSDDMHCKYSTV